MSEERYSLVTIKRALLSDVSRRFFRDGPPQWPEGQARNPPKSAAEARHDRALLAKALRRDRSPEARALAEALEACRSARPCLSGACPACGRALQRMFVHATRNLFVHHDRDMEAINIVSAKGGIRYGRLYRHDVFEGIERRLHRALSAVGLPAVGGFDISANEHEADAFEPHWMPHAWILAPGRRARRARKDLGDWFEATEIVPRAVFMKPFDGGRAGRAYALKPDFCRRTSLEPRALEDGSRSTFSTRKKPIWGDQRVELALALDRAGLESRLFLQGYELVIADGDVEIVRVGSIRRKRELVGDFGRDHGALGAGR
jgi:hypothetical protein